MLHVCICDDEKLQRSGLKSTISTQLELKGIDFSVHEFENGESLKSVLIKDNNYFDIIFLDIEMNGINGIETARKIRELNDKVVIIFVTGFSDYVFDGYEVKALNYILKPYINEKIVDVLFEALKQVENVQNDFFIVQLNRSSYKISLSDIIYFVSDKRKLKLITKQTTYEFYAKLDDIEKKMPSYYVRIHNRYLVNLNFVRAIENNSVDANGEKLPISRTRYQEVMIAFAKSMLS
ncbi:two component transcriptional regulator, LytTR family [Clostridium cavendishii DSM 21758]|uniref:Stage 0 sporulation protein A homolog n=1 Tax=Clostridium cavendishii DSM 21758 TaxID=1121302 RepID=A0A1M6MJ41_9CLOT|nr:LytTR family DNA-binding domain-containing protein [Clostridium cavendishii]SHJ83478.1 two component transcriptional regulator, LytTR family [Clostridium cavendishii DSM 21758]